MNILHNVKAIFSNETVSINEDIENNDNLKKIVKGYKSLRGKTLQINNKFMLKEVTFENINECINKNIIVIPEFQRLIDTNKIEKMYNSYKLNPNLFNFMTNPIQLAKLTFDNLVTYYLIDGQHRFYMYKKLFEENINVSIKICIITCDTVEEMHDYYNKLNCDNKNNLFNNVEIYKYQDINRYYLLRNEFKKHYCKYFKNNDSNIYSIEEFVKILQNNNFLQIFENYENLSISDFINYIIDQNNIFYLKCYSKLTDYKFKKNESNLISNKFIMALRDNNFIEFLLREDDNEPFDCIHKIHVISKKKIK